VNSRRKGQIKTDEDIEDAGFTEFVLSSADKVRNERTAFSRLPCNCQKDFLSRYFFLRSKIFSS